VASADNWLRTPFLTIGPTARVYIDINFTVRKCTKFPDPASLQQCKESFRLLYREADADYEQLSPTAAFNESTYKSVDVIAANRVFTDNTDVVVNEETRSVRVTRRGFHFAFEDQGGCTTLMSVRVYYVVCPSVVGNFARFSNTSTAADLSSVVRVEGVCMPKASMVLPPTYLCQSDGSWYPVSGGCACMPGYQPDLQASQQCTGLCILFYKNN